MSDSAVAAAIAAGLVPSDISEAYLNESKDQATISGILFILCLTIVIVFLRVVARLLVLKRFGLDDWLTVISLALLGGYVALCLKLIAIGSGRHYEYILYVMDVATQNLDETLDFYAHIIYTTALVLCRLSGLSFYHHICNMDRRFELGIKIQAGILIALYLLQLFLIIFHCIPVTTLWPFSVDDQETGFTCLAWGLVYSVNSAVSLVCDAMLFGIPIAMLYILDMSRRRKIQLACILLPGITVVAFSVTRMVLVIQGQWAVDETWTYDPMLAMEVAEIGGTLIALSVPGVKPLYNLCISGTVDSSSSGGKYGGSMSRRGTGVMHSLNSRPRHNILSGGDNFASKGPHGYDYELEGGVKDNNSMESTEGILKRVEVHVGEQKSGSSP